MRANCCLVSASVKSTQRDTTHARLSIMSHFYTPRDKRKQYETADNDKDELFHKSFVKDDITAFCRAKEFWMIWIAEIHWCTHCGCGITCDYSLMCWTWIIPLNSTLFSDAIRCHSPSIQGTEIKWIVDASRKKYQDVSKFRSLSTAMWCVRCIHAVSFAERKFGWTCKFISLQ